VKVGDGVQRQQTLCPVVVVRGQGIAPVNLGMVICLRGLIAAIVVFEEAKLFLEITLHQHMNVMSEPENDRVPGQWSACLLLFLLYF
jgi:hypothetical protein